MKLNAYKIFELSVVCLISLTLLACQRRVATTKLSETIGVGFIINPNCADGNGSTVEVPAGVAFFEEAKRPTIQVEAGSFIAESAECVPLFPQRIVDSVEITDPNRTQFPKAISSRLTNTSIEVLADQKVSCLVLTAFDASAGPAAIIGTGFAVIDPVARAISGNAMNFSVMTHKIAISESMGEGAHRLICPKS